MGYDAYFPKLPEINGYGLVHGFTSGLAFNFLLDKNLSFLTIKPGYTYATDQIDTWQMWQFEATIGTPVDKNKQAWLEFAYIYLDGEISFNDYGIRRVQEANNNHVVKMAFNYYFL